jgi:hypothetical protein
MWNLSLLSCDFNRKRSMILAGQAMTVTVSSGGMEARQLNAATVDLRTDGGDEWLAVATAVHLGKGAQLQVACPAGGGDCIADAVMVESAARYNDGSAADTVALGPMDAAMLRKTTGAAAHCKVASQK